MKIVILSAVFVAVVSGIAPLHRVRPSQRISDSYLIRFRESAQADRRDVLGQMVAFARERNIQMDVTKVFHYVMPGIAAQIPDDRIDEIRALEDVEDIYEDGLVTTAKAQTGVSWGLDRIDQREGMAAFDGIYDPKGEVNNHTVYAYILDTGINPRHVDFQGRAIPWYDAVGDGRNCIDCNGHGTHCAGILGSQTYGVAKATNIRMVRVMDCWGTGKHSILLAGMDYIVANGDKPGVVSMSLTSYGSRVLDDATQELVKNGFVVAAAAGNRNRKACSYSPARLKSIMTVGATDFLDRRSSDSNYGTCVDIFAPGSYITSLAHDSTTGTETMSGTSMACPFVAGAAALLFGKDPSLGPAEVKSKIVGMSSKGRITDAGDGSPNRMLYINLSQ